MRVFNYTEKWIDVLTPEIIMLLTQIHEYKGKQDLCLDAKEDVLLQLIDIAKIQSTEASNKIEGIRTTDERLNALIKDKTMPKDRSECEIAGYRDVLNTIHENYKYILIKPTMILQLHRDLYKFESSDIGGKYKSADNVIEEEDANGNKHLRFKPVAAWETPDAMQKLCDAFDKATSEEKIDLLVLIPMFILDFLCIHPFNDGNGRMSRLLTLLMLYRAGYIVGKYISIEHLIEKTKDSYYINLEQSSIKWHEDENDYIPFIKYMLGIVVAAYRAFSDRVEMVETNNLSKPERIAKLIKESYGEITKTEILKKCQNISQVTVQRTLADLLEKG
ncbi:MAG: Fic family protein, partial [Lachnospiraceae bacterium]|nr:Fic family protein [Lachnospiraceae bacterium]